MQKTNSELDIKRWWHSFRPVGTALMVLAIHALPVDAQGQAKSLAMVGADGQRAVVGHAFGDTAKHAVRVLNLDPTNETANVYLGAPKNLLVIAVVPGREIEVIYPGDMTLGKGVQNTFAFLMHRFELTTAAGGHGGISAQDRQAYENCQRNRAAIMRRNDINSRSKKDSLGRPVSAGAAAVSGNEVPSCEMPTGESKTSLARRQLPRRADADRYLMVVTSSSAVNLTDLEDRLAGLTTVAPDVGLTIEAIAAGIFAGRSGSYGGTWVAW